MIKTIKRFLELRKANIGFLRQAANTVGKEIEEWSYEKLSQPAEVISFSREIDNVTVSFSLEAYEENKAGDLHMCVDVDARISKFPYLKIPSYVFWKKKDGGIYY